VLGVGYVMYKVAEKSKLCTPLDISTKYDHLCRKKLIMSKISKENKMLVKKLND